MSKNTSNSTTLLSRLDAIQIKITKLSNLLASQIIPNSNVLKLDQEIKTIPNLDNSPVINQKIQSLTDQLTEFSKNSFIQRKLAEVKNLLYSLVILDSNQQKLTQYETLLREFVLQFDINPVQTEDEQNKSFKQFIDTKLAPEKRDEFLNISRELLITPQLNELINCLKYLGLTKEKAILEKKSHTLQAEIPIELTPDQQDRFLESSIQLKELLTAQLKKLIYDKYKLKINEQKYNDETKTRQPLPLEEQTESVLNYISENTKTSGTDEQTATDRFKKNLLENIGSLMPKYKPEEPNATYSFSRLIKIQKDLDAYLHPKLKSDETPSEELTDINTSLLSQAMQAAIDSNGQELSWLGDKLCKVNILKIIKKQFDKEKISSEEKAFYLRLFLKTAGTHRNTNNFSFFQSPGAETASIQAFKKFLMDAKLPEALSNFINADIGEVLENDKTLRNQK